MTLRLRLAIELRNALDTDFGDRALHVSALLPAALLRVLTSADLALDLNVRAFSERRGEIGEAPEYDAAMPIGVRFPLVGFAILPTPFGRD
jgi:hypothetical protein